MIMHWLQGWLAVALLMTALWALQRKTRNAGSVDVAWAASIAALALFHVAHTEAIYMRKLLTGFMAVCWGFRLAWHIHARNAGRPEDGRYTQLRKDWAGREDRKMFEFFQFQALAAAYFSMPFLLALGNPAPRILPFEWAAFALWILAWLGESTADAQLVAFKKSRGGRGEVCRAGWWKYSRHPNYFFELLIWVSVALFALPAPWGWMAISCPLAIAFFLFKVTGIPATEAQALRSKGGAYREYQRTTSMFIPWPPRR